MQIEFRQHQLVVAGLTAQINILNQRCVEHRATITAKDAAIEAIRQQAKQQEDCLKMGMDLQEAAHNRDINGYEQRCEALETRIAELETTIRECKAKSRKSKRASAGQSKTSETPKS